MLVRIEEISGIIPSNRPFLILRDLEFFVVNNFAILKAILSVKYSQ